MKIGINTLFYIPGEVGGSETYLLEILRRWRLHDSDHEFTLFTQHENHDKLQNEFSGPRWSFERLPFNAMHRPTRILWEQCRLPGRVKHAEMDVLWSPGYTAPLSYRGVQAVSIHDMQYKSFPHDLTPMARLATDFLVCRAARRCRTILTVSEFSRREILKYTHAREDQIVVTPEAADPLFRHPPEVPLPEPVASPYLLCVANTYPHKHVDQLIRVFGTLSSAYPHRLVLVGKPRLGEPEVQNALSTCPASDRIIRLEGVTRETLAALYAKADVFVFPSRYEGFGLPVLEALTAGAPVVTTRCASIPEVGGEAAVYYNGTDADLEHGLREVLDAPPDTKKARRESGLKQANQFDWGVTARQTLKALLDSALQKNQPPSST